MVLIRVTKQDCLVHKADLHSLADRSSSRLTKQAVQGALNIVISLLEGLDRLRTTESHPAQLLHAVDIVFGGWCP
jgi:hypothetical protein